MSEHLGIQWMIELYGCNTVLLDDKLFIGQLIETAAIKANATVVQQFFHQFSPYGVSGTVVIAESHINIHTWPEHAYAAIDIFTCGELLDAQKAIDYLSATLEVKEQKVSKYLRGSKADIKRVGVV